MNTEISWHALAGTEVLSRLGVEAARGLDSTEASKRLAQDGANELVHETSKPWWKVLLAQFANLLVAILIAAAIVSFLLGDSKDGIAILAIVLLNAALGFKQEFSAEQAMAALKKLSVPRSRVRRDGQIREVDARTLVKGDILLIEAGNLIPADARLVESASLRVQESALTGESQAVGKTTDALGDGAAALGDRRNMLHMGTIVTYGRGEAVVTATGMGTELGRVAELLSSTEDEQTPLARKIAHVGKVLIGIALALISVVAVLGVLRGDDARTVFLTAVSMAVAAVPEGLPAVVTIALALGAKRMLARRALIRSLPAVETLGAVTAICTDKTGTLTQNVMTVTVAESPDRRLDIPPHLAETVALGDEADLRMLLTAAALCNDATLASADPELRALGDPTEGALVVSAHRGGLVKDKLLDLLPRCGEAPFDSDRKRMATVHEPQEGTASALTGSGVKLGGARAVVFAKGAMESMLDISTRVCERGHERDLSEEDRRRWREKADSLAADGIRVLAVAWKPLQEVPVSPGAAELESALVFLGLLGMMDPLRKDVGAAVQTCMEAGIRPVMITGDHPLMAGHIARQLGMRGGDKPLAGAEIEPGDEALCETVRETSVYARVSPEQKLRIVDALQATGEIIAMTGDGVNDAPALKSADIGVAMGITGTDVAKEASDMILLDDRYGTIVDAVREGRVIFDNIRRFMRFILASNTGELLVMLLAPFMGMPLPLLPVQILWMNLVTDGLPALALGVEKAEGDVMKRPPRDPRRPIIDGRMAWHVLRIGLFMAVLSLGVGWMAWRDGGASGGGGLATHGSHETVQAEVWQTMLFCTMVFAQLFLALGVRSSRDSLFRIGIFSNRPLTIAILATFALQVAVVYVPPLQGFFATRSLSGSQLGISVGVGALVLVFVELEKAVRRWLRKEA